MERIYRRLRAWLHRPPETHAAPWTTYQQLLDKEVENSTVAWQEAKRINDLLVEAQDKITCLESDLARQAHAHESIVRARETCPVMSGSWNDVHPFDGFLAERAIRIGENTRGAEWGFDGAVLLMFPGWDGEMRGNRWHVVDHLTRTFPVLIVQPNLLPQVGGPVIRPDKSFKGAFVLETLYHAGVPDDVEECRQHARDIEWAMRRIGMSRPLFWLFSPYFAKAFVLLEGYRLVHATEDWIAFPTLPDWVKADYVRALGAADQIVAVSSGVAASLASTSALGPVDVVTNGCQYARYAHAAPDPRVVELRRPGTRLVVFAGNIDARLDYELLNRARAEVADLVFCMVGPVAGLTEQDEAHWKRFLSQDGVTWLGRMDADDLPGVYHAADVGIVPYKHEPYLVESNFSLKVMEMAAAGLPVVVSLMKPVRGIARAIEVCDDQDTFIAALRRRSRAALGEEEKAELDSAAKDSDYARKFARVIDTAKERFARKAT